MTITFDDAQGQNRMLGGDYPQGIINWGVNRWWLSGPWQSFTTKSVSFNGPSRTSGVFTFMTPRRLISIQAYNGGNTATNLTFSCLGQTTRQVTLAAGQIATVDIGWTGPCSNVTITSSNGYFTNFDNMVISGS
jgi:hypothetical protein